MAGLNVDISKLPIIKDKNSWTIFVDGAEQIYEDCDVRCRSIWRNYGKWIILGLFVIVIIIVIVLIVVAQSATPSYPCLPYDTNTLASSVSVPCLQYVWNQVCPSSPYLFSQEYTGWWNRSPKGTTLVRCSGTAPCGAGSYGNILIYMASCQINYGT